MTDIKCFKCGEEFCLEEHVEEGYSSIAKCPKCKGLNSCTHLMI